VVWALFLGGFLTVHLVTILPPFTSVELRSIIEPWLAGRRLVQGPAWVYVAYIRRICTLLVLAFAINCVQAIRVLAKSSTADFPTKGLHG
jgi:hypothetical protein